MNRYMIFIHGDGEAFEALSPEQAQQMIDHLKPFEETVRSEGKLLGTHRLHPASRSTLLKVRNGERSVTDGPYAESKEQLGGYYLVEADSQEQVLGWLDLIPALMDSTLEVRQVVDEERSIP